MSALKGLGWGILTVTVGYVFLRGSTISQALRVRSFPAMIAALRSPGLEIVRFTESTGLTRRPKQGEPTLWAVWRWEGPKWAWENYDDEAQARAVQAALTAPKLGYRR